MYLYKPKKIPVLSSLIWFPSVMQAYNFIQEEKKSITCVFRYGIYSRNINLCILTPLETKLTKYGSNGEILELVLISTKASCQNTITVWRD